MTTRPRESRSERQSTLEIERKYLLRGMPTLPKAVPVEVWRIEQGYLDANAQSSLRGGRIRRTTYSDGLVKCFHTIKRGVGMVRQEVEQAISPDEFEHEWPHTRGARLKKTRHRVREGDLIWEIDEFDGIDLVLAEVELPSVNAAFEIPDWLRPFVVREVTDDPLFTNSSIARRRSI